MAIGSWQQEGIFLTLPRSYRLALTTSLDDDVTDMTNPRQAPNHKPLASLVPATSTVPKAEIKALVVPETDAQTKAQSSYAATDAKEVEVRSKQEDLLASDLGKLTLAFEARDLDVSDDEPEDHEDIWFQSAV